MFSVRQSAPQYPERLETLWKRLCSSLPRSILSHRLGVEMEVYLHLGRPSSLLASSLPISFRSLLTSIIPAEPAEQHYIPLPSALTFIMIATLSFLLSSFALSFASPLVSLEARTVTALNTAAFEEAHPRDNTATRAFSSTEIKVSSPIRVGWLVLMSRPRPTNVSSSMNCLEISVQT